MIGELLESICCIWDFELMHYQMEKYVLRWILESGEFVDVTVDLCSRHEYV